MLTKLILLVTFRITLGQNQWSLADYEHILTSPIVQEVKTFLSHNDAPGSILFAQGKYYAGDETAEQLNIIGLIKNETVSGGNFHIGELDKEEIDFLTSRYANRSLIASTAQIVYNQNGTLKDVVKDNYAFPIGLIRTYENFMMEHTKDTIRFVYKEATFQSLTYYPNGKLKENSTATISLNRPYMTLAEQVFLKEQDFLLNILQSVYEFKATPEMRLKLINDLLSRNSGSIEWEVFTDSSKVTQGVKKSIVEVGETQYIFIGKLKLTVL